MPEDVVARALGYPYPREPDAFVWREGGVSLFTGEVPEGAVPVLGYGSNASVEQLDRKFGDLKAAVIPTLPFELVDWDVVYAPFISHYGSIPATLAPSPGTRVQVWLQWLTPPVLARMDETEGVPEVYRRFRGEQTAYLAVAGALALDGAPVALAEVPAEGRRFPALRQWEVQRELAGPEQVEEFIRQNVADRVLRRERSRSLPRVPVDPPHGPPFG
jgi:hypothetical protein